MLCRFPGLSQGQLGLRGIAVTNQVLDFVIVCGRSAGLLAHCDTLVKLSKPMIAGKVSYVNLSFCGYYLNVLYRLPLPLHHP